MSGRKPSHFPDRRRCTVVSTSPTEIPFSSSRAKTRAGPASSPAGVLRQPKRSLRNLGLTAKRQESASPSAALRWPGDASAEGNSRLFPTGKTAGPKLRLISNSSVRQQTRLAVFQTRQRHTCADSFDLAVGQVSKAVSRLACHLRHCVPSTL